MVLQQYYLDEQRLVQPLDCCSGIQYNNDHSRTLNEPNRNISHSG